MGRKKVRGDSQEGTLGAAAGILGGLALEGGGGKTQAITDSKGSKKKRGERLSKEKKSGVLLSWKKNLKFLTKLKRRKAVLETERRGGSPNSSKGRSKKDRKFILTLKKEKDSVMRL